ncbi:MAG: cysteine-rich small domain-containing protein [Methanotrichaceae archaeon]
MRRISCDKYPCHFSGQDCTFCFCPFYPCLDERTGGRFVDGEWCCKDCTIIHQKEVAEMVMEALVQGEDLSSIWKKVVKKL